MEEAASLLSLPSPPPPPPSPGLPSPRGGNFPESELADSEKSPLLLIGSSSGQDRETHVLGRERERRAARDVDGKVYTPMVIAASGAPDQSTGRPDPPFRPSEIE